MSAKQEQDVTECTTPNLLRRHFSELLVEFAGENQDLDKRTENSKSVRSLGHGLYLA